MTMSDKHFIEMVAELTTTIAGIVDLAAQHLSPVQTDALLGVLSVNLAGLMERHLGRAAMVERFVELGDYYRERGVDVGALQ